jgi:hypothetical protein
VEQKLISRRSLVRAGVLGLGPLTLAELLRSRSAAASLSSVRSSERIVPTADHCILVFLDGGPSHLDTFDLKPDAPAEIRGEFQAISSSLPGVPICEHLPRFGQHLHRFAQIRSVSHGVNNAHASAVYCALTGHDRGEVGVGNQANDYPAIGSVLARTRPPAQPTVPFVTLPYIPAEGRGGPPQPGFFGGLLGRAADPLFILKDPNAGDFAVPEVSLLRDVSVDRFRRRWDLANRLDQRFQTDSTAAPRAVDGFRQQAADVLCSSATAAAFRLQEEADSVRDAYGRNIYGQSTLLARRLIEAGTRMVTIAWAPDANATWDTHGSNFTRLKGELLPQLDAAVGSLMSDLVDRGLLERTLVVVMGEFGRTPRINAAAGRDHWNFCYSVVMAGGGIIPGAIHGRSDRIGAFPASDPVGAADVIATVYHCLGLPAHYELRDSLQRPFELVPWGHPVASILSTGSKVS